MEFQKKRDYDQLLKRLKGVLKGETKIETLGHINENN